MKKIATLKALGLYALALIVCFVVEFVFSIFTGDPIVLKETMDQATTVLLIGVISEHYKTREKFKPSQGGVKGSNFQD